MNRNDITSLVADIAETMDRVRDLDIEAHRRAAALQCLADARRHLGGVRSFAQVARPPGSEWLTPIGVSPVLGLDEEKPPTPPSIPPRSSNQAMREKATEAFRESRRILKEIVR